MKTRAKKPSPPNRNPSHADGGPDTTAKTLAPPVPNPPHVFILPKGLSPRARILTIPNPATSTPCRYLIDPEKQGCYDFTRVAAPKRACRSWLLAPDRSLFKHDAENGEDRKDREGYIIDMPDLMVATPMDPLFLILPALAVDAEETGRQMFLSPSEYLDRLEERSQHFKELVQSEYWSQNLEQMFEARMRTVCDGMEIGDNETLYRLSTPELLDVLVAKARRIVEKALFPPSMEERFVKQALAVPVLSVRREESSISIADEDRSVGGAENDITSSAATSQQDSQTSSVTTTSTSTAATSVSSQTTSSQEPKENDQEIIHLLRLRTVLNYLLTSYTPTTLHLSLQSLLSRPASSPIDFTPLDAHLAHLTNLRKEAQTLRSLSDNISRKRSHVDEDDEEAREKADAKKRKKEEEEIRKKNVSRGVKQLEKADRSGMRSLSSFFSAKGGVAVIGKKS